MNRPSERLRQPSFLKEGARTPQPQPQLPPFKILLVDDDREMHTLTRLVLQGYVYQQRGLEFLSAYSGAEARELIANHPDTALILLDVVMETDNAGLEVVRFIRDTLGNRLVRIVLRTGQPGQAPEREVILNYDINDYKEKTELTAQKLFTTVTSSLRSYRDLVTLEQSQRGLKAVTEASALLFEPRSIPALTQGLLRQLTLLLEKDAASERPAFVVRCDREHELHVLAATGSFREQEGKNIAPALDENTRQLLLDALHNRGPQFGRDCLAGFFETRSRLQYLCYFRCSSELSPIDRQMLEVYANNATLAFDNIALTRDILSAQSQIVCMLGEVVEHRSRETGNHVRRMTELSCLLARHCGMTAEDLALLQMAAPLHDVGKIGIPDHILHKPGRLTDEEMAIMRTHTTIGYEILKNSDRPVFQAAAQIALQHHEKWNGSGYPLGLAGDNISLSGRVTALADVVDALGHKRCYKEAWSLDRILELVRRERGQHFDPQVADVFLAHLPEYQEIQQEFPSHEPDAPTTSGADGAASGS